MLHEYINNDLLGIHGNIVGNSGKSILPNILYTVEGSINILQQTAARLLNTIASLRCGRDYLSIGTATLNAVSGIKFLLSKFFLGNTFENISFPW